MYRAKVKSDDPVISKRWAYGDKVTIGDRVFIVLDDAEYDKDGLSHGKYQEVISGFIEVIPESIGQSTGRQDMDGVEIFNKDIVKLCYGIPPTFDTLVIEYADDEIVHDISVSGWWMRNIRANGTSGSLCKTYECDLEVIGNTTDNPELLQDQAK